MRPVKELVTNEARLSDLTDGHDRWTRTINRIGLIIGRSLGRRNELPQRECHS